MPKKFHKILSFEVEGELYDENITPEELIAHYIWRFTNYNDGRDTSFLLADNKDGRGHIVKMTKLPNTENSKNRRKNDYKSI